ncbi:hypothetical protein J6590_021441 [Homalodisca vitripennis]|nr:hypothetical protein J6590_021441 [Homalodisca vitripennis]
MSFVPPATRSRATIQSTLKQMSTMGLCAQPSVDLFVNRSRVYFHQLFGFYGSDAAVSLAGLWSPRSRE